MCIRDRRTPALRSPGAGTVAHRTPRPPSRPGRSRPAAAAVKRPAANASAPNGTSVWVLAAVVRDAGPWRGSTPAPVTLLRLTVIRASRPVANQAGGERLRLLHLQDHRVGPQVRGPA